MAISSTQYIDLLYKSLSGVAKTDLPANKSSSNESIASPLLIRGDQTWTESGSIPSTAAAVSGIVQAYTGSSKATATADTTAQAVGGVYPSWKTNLTNWIPPQFDTANITNTYRVKIYYGASGLSDPASSGGTQIFADGSGGTGEWYFDYSSGVLNFIGGTIPSGMTGSSVIYVYGHRYVGKVGVTNLPSLSVSGTSTFTSIIASSATITSLSNSSSTNTGALVVNGGLGVGGNAYIGGDLTVVGTISATISGVITTATNIAGGTAGQLVYQTGAGATSFTGPGTSGQILVSAGTGAPTYTNTGSINVGRADLAGAWVSARTITLDGDLGGSVSIDGSGNATLTATIQANSVALGTDTTGDYVATGATSGFGLSGSTTGESATFTITSNATSSNTVSTIVYRDTSGNFSAGTITAATAFSGTLGTGGSQSINTNALTLSGYADNGGILFFSNGSGLVASDSTSFSWDSATGTIRIKTSTTASSTTTGALVVTGGAGIGGSLYVGNSATILSNVASTTTVANNALYVAGGVGVEGSLYVKGKTIFEDDVLFSGTTTYVYSTQTIYTDNIINIHTPPGGIEGSWTVDDGKDIGFVFHNYKSADNDSFLGWANDSGYLEWYGSGLETTGSVFTNATYGTFKTGGIILTYTTASNSTSSGALTVAGGVGIGGDLWVGGTINGTVTTATNLAGGTAGQVPYQTAAGVTSFYGPGTSGQILVSAGTGAPTYTNTGSINVGRADLAGAWVSARTITLDGDLSGNVSIDGSGNATLTATIVADSVALGTDTTGNYVATGATSGFGLSGSASAEGATFTVTSNATSSNTVSTLVYRDTSGNFSAGTITGLITTATNIAGGTAGQLVYQTADGTTNFAGPGTSGQILVSAGTGAPTYTNTGSINVGRADLAGAWVSARTITLDGDLGGSVSIDGSGNATLTATIQANSVALGTDTTGDYVATGATSGFGLSGSSSGETATFTVNANSTSSNTISTIVYRDTSGNFSAGTITAGLSGNATSADKWSTARTITLNGDLSGNVTLDGSGNATLTATIVSDSVALGSDTTGNYVASGATSGHGLSGSANSETATFTVNLSSTSSNTTSTVVFRDESGNFSANVITADILGTASNANDLTGGSAGSLPYQSGAGVTVFLPLGTDGKVLQVNTATNSVVWGDIDGGVY